MHIHSVQFDIIFCNIVKRDSEVRQNDQRIVNFVKDNKIDGKYIMTFLSTNQYDFKSRENGIELVKTYDGIEKYFNEEGNEIKK